MKAHSLMVVYLQSLTLTIPRITEGNEKNNTFLKERNLSSVFKAVLHRHPRCLLTWHQGQKRVYVYIYIAKNSNLN